MAAISASKAVCCPPWDLFPWAMTAFAPAPSSEVLMAHPSPANLRNEPSVHACRVLTFSGGSAHGVRLRDLGVDSPQLVLPLSTLVKPPGTKKRPVVTTSRPWRGGGKSDLFGVPLRADKAEARSLSLRRSSAGLAGGMSAALTASSFSRAERARYCPSECVRQLGEAV